MGYFNENMVRFTVFNTNNLVSSGFLLERERERERERESILTLLVNLLKKSFRNILCPALFLTNKGGFLCTSPCRPYTGIRYKDDTFFLLGRLW